MAGREINIPFGPDRTGGFDLSSMIPEVEPSEPVDELDADLLDVDPVDASSDQGLPSRQADDLADVFADGFDDGQEVADDAETAEEGEGSSAIADVQASLVALKDSIDQGRELKAREKEREYTFSVLLPPSDLGKGCLPGEKILVSGSVDLLFFEEKGAVIVDFKTDSVKKGFEKQAAERHRPQLEVYEKAVREIFETPVIQKTVFFLKTGVGAEL